MRISSHCNDPTESDSQFGCVSLILIACAVTSTVLALLFVGLLAWRQSVKDHRARRAARQQDIDLEERAFSTNAFARTESIASEVSAPPSYHSMQDDVMVVSAPTEGMYEEKRGEIEGRVPGSETGKTSEGQGSRVPDVVGTRKYPMPETWRDSMDLSLENPPLEKGVAKMR